MDFGQKVFLAFGLPFEKGEGERFIAYHLRLIFPILLAEKSFLSQGSVFLFAALAFSTDSPFVQKTLSPLL